MLYHLDLAIMPKFEFSNAALSKRLFDVSRGKNGFVISDVESMAGFAMHNVEIMTNYLHDCVESNVVPVLVGKCSHVARLQAKFPGVVFPENLIYFFLHAGVGRCPDDAFIHELYAYLKKSGLRTYICSNDKYSNKKSWIQGDLKVYKTMISHNDKPKRPRDHNDPEVDFYKPHDKTIIETKISPEDEFPFRYTKKELLSLADMIAASAEPIVPKFTFSMFGGSVDALYAVAGGGGGAGGAAIGSVGYFTPAGKRKLDALAATGDPILMAPEGADKKAKMHVD
jgi:hypothetical protein